MRLETPLDKVTKDALDGAVETIRGNSPDGGAKWNPNEGFKIPSVLGALADAVKGKQGSPSR